MNRRELWTQKASRLLLETMSEINKKMQATILMVTHDPFSASFCERILFLKDGKIFNEIFRGEKAEKISSMKYWIY